MAKPKSSKTSKTIVPPADGASDIPPVLKGPVGNIQNDERTSSLMKHPRSSATRQQIREVEHRTMGSRQSQKPVERSNQQRQTRKASGKKK